MWTPEPGQLVEVTIKGRVKSISCKGQVALIERTDGRPQFVDIPDDLMGAVTFRPGEGDRP